jgi:transcriptional regulator with XRE-family HTH domain
MKLDPVKVDELRKEKGLSVNGLSHLLGVCRTTIWKWIRGLLIPNERKVRKLADVLEVPVNEISDLSGSAPQSNSKISNFASALDSFAGSGILKKQQEFQAFSTALNKLNQETVYTNIILKAILSSTDFIIYIKDAEQKYITASSSFIANLNLLPGYSVIGKTDEDFFTVRGAKNNSDEDSKVINTGDSVINREAYIPGSRRKKWGLISKYPIFDNEKKISGVIGIIHDISDKKAKELE